MRRGAVLFVIFAASMGSVSMAQMPQHLQWNRIEIPLTSQRDYSSGNPYRDLTIEATFTQRVTLKKVVGYGFWNGGTDFRVRTALPPGIWDWSTKCYGVTASKYCNQAGNFANDSGLWKTGSFQVCAYKDATCLNKPSTGVPAIYLRGFLKTPRSTSNQPARYLVYDDGTKFFWSADTAWEAPVDANPTNWNTYLADRKNKKFTTVLVGSAPQYSGTIVSFDQIQNCSSSYPVPNPCSRWNTAYWQKFDTLVQAANQAGLVVVVVGLVDPVDRGKYDTGTYPLSSEAVTFARNLAARLSGNFVIFSPGFDDRKDARLGDQVSTVQQSMNAVLSELQRVVPRHLLTNHLAGSSSVADYDLFKTWVKFNLYQSGHALNLAAACPGLSLTRQQCAVKRARELSLNFVDGIHPKPAVNGEGGYEYPTNPNAVPPDNRYGVRHTGYYSVLSGSFGFTLGVDKIVHWEDPMTNLNSLSARDMTILAARFRGRRWYEMKPMHERIKNNQGLPEEQRMVLAGTGDNALAIGYLPNNISIQIDTSLFSGLSCTSTIWTRQWIDPRVGNAIDIPKTACADGTGRITLSRPPCNPNSNPAVSGACDWIVELRNTKVNTSDNSTAMLLPDQVLAMTIVKTWAQVDDSGDTSTILADLVDSSDNVLAPGIVVSPGNAVFQQLPTAGRDSSDRFFVVWQADELDGNLDGIFARRYDSQGQALGERFQVNTYALGDQGEPSITISPSGDAVVVWTSNGQDGDVGGIYGQRYDASGNPMGIEFQINTYTVDHQGAPQVMADQFGNFVVAWTSDGQDGSGQGVYLQRFNYQGVPLGGETRVNTTTAGDQILSTLRVLGGGDFTVSWSTYDAYGNFLGVLYQEYDIYGNPIGGEF